MLDIDNMIRTNDFTDLLHATEEEREKSGGNFYLYSKLIHYICFENIREVVKYAFRNNAKILEDVEQRYKKCSIFTGDER